MAKRTTDVEETPMTEAVETPVAVEAGPDNRVRYSIALASKPKESLVVVSSDGSIEDAVRVYNQGRPKPFTAKQLVIALLA